MEISKEQFQEWKESFATQEFFRSVEQRIAEAKELLAYNAGNDSLVDKFNVGMIHAFKEVLDVSYEETQ